MCLTSPQADPEAGPQAGLLVGLQAGPQADKKRHQDAFLYFTSRPTSTPKPIIVRYTELVSELQNTDYEIQIIKDMADRAPGVELSVEEMALYAKSGKQEDLPKKLRELTPDQKHSTVMKFMYLQSKIIYEIMNDTLDCIDIAMRRRRLRCDDDMLTYLNQCIYTLKKITKTCITVTNSAKGQCVLKFMTIYNSFLKSFSKQEAAFIQDSAAAGAAFGAFSAAAAGYGCGGVEFFMSCGTISSGLAQLCAVGAFGFVGCLAGGAVGYGIVSLWRWWKRRNVLKGLDKQFPNEYHEYIQERRKKFEEINKDSQIPNWGFFTHLADWGLDFSRHISSPVPDQTVCVCCKEKFTLFEVHTEKNVTLDSCQHVIKFQAVATCSRDNPHFIHTAGNCRTEDGRFRAQRYFRNTKSPCMSCHPPKVCP